MIDTETFPYLDEKLSEARSAKFKMESNYVFDELEVPAYFEERWERREQKIQEYLEFTKWCKTDYSHLRSTFMRNENAKVADFPPEVRNFLETLLVSRGLKMIVEDSLIENFNSFVEERGMLPTQVQYYAFRNPLIALAVTSDLTTVPATFRPVVEDETWNNIRKVVDDVREQMGELMKTPCGKFFANGAKSVLNSSGPEDMGDPRLWKRIDEMHNLD